MTDTHVQSKAEEALRQSGGKRSQAAALLHAWADADANLRNQLILPYLDEAVSKAIHSTAKRLDIKDPSIPPPGKDDARGLAMIAERNATLYDFVTPGGKDTKPKRQ